MNPYHYRDSLRHKDSLDAPHSPRLGCLEKCVLAVHISDAMHGIQAIGWNSWRYIRPHFYQEIDAVSLQDFSSATASFNEPTHNILFVAILLKVV